MLLPWSAQVLISVVLQTCWRLVLMCDLMLAEELLVMVAEWMLLLRRILGRG